MSGARGSDQWTSVEVALEWLASTERQRRSAIKRLKAFGVIRSPAVVGDLGEWFASLYYGVPYERSRHPGYDLQVDKKNVEVKALLSYDYRRGTMGRLTPNLTHVFAVRLNQDFLPVEAFEIPRAVIEEHCQTGRMQLSARVERDPRVKTIEGDELIHLARKHLAARRTTT